MNRAVAALAAVLKLALPARADSIHGHFPGTIAFDGEHGAFLPLRADGQKVIRIRLERPKMVVLRFETRRAVAAGNSSKLMGASVLLLVDGSDMDFEQTELCSGNATAAGGDGESLAFITRVFQLAAGFHTVQLFTIFEPSLAGAQPNSGRLLSTCCCEGQPAGG
jgi:hypothetical protein